MLENFFRSLMMTICSVLYPLIPKLYSLFYDIASTKLLTTEQIQTFSRNIYVLVSVVMLFAFAVKAIESIINPDMLFDSKKGFTSVIKRSLIAICLIIFIPFGFNYFYKAQEQILEKNLIEKVLVGIQISDGENVADKSGAGQILAGTAIAAVLYPSSDDVTTSSETLSKNYSKMVEKDVSKIKDVGDNINEKVNDDDTYVLQFEWLPAVLMGAFMVYFLVLFCIDTALRLIKMAFLELTAPISVVAYIFAGDDMLKRWFKEVKNSAISVFVRIAALALMIYIMSFLPSFIDKNFNGKDYGWIANLLIIMAILMFVKEAPKLIEKIFGVEIPQKGGISGRLGNMAGVGKVAQNAWQTLGKVGKLGAAAAGLGAGALALGAGKKFDEKVLGGKVSNVANRIKNSTPARAASGIGRAAYEGVKAGGGLKGMKAAKDSYKSSWYGSTRKAIKDDKDNREFADDVGVDYERGSVQGASDDITKAKRAYNRLDRKLESSSMSKAQKDAIRNKISANKNKATAEKLKDHHTGIQDILNAAAEHTTDENMKQKLQNLSGDFKAGNISLDDMNRKIAGMGGKELSRAQANDIIGKLNNINNMVTNDPLLVDLKNSDGGVSGRDIAAKVDGLTTASTNADNMYSKIHDSLGDKAKSEMDRYVNNGSIIEKEYVKEVGKAENNKYNKIKETSSNSSSSDSNSGVTHRTLQENIDEAANVHAAPTREEHNERQDYYTRFFNDPAVSNAIDRNEQAASGGYSSNNSSSNNNSGSNSNNNNSSNNDGNGYNTNQPSSPNTNAYSSNNGSNGNTSSGQDLSGLFDNLSKDIKDANNATNSILEDQLKAQKSILDENQKQSTKLNNINTGIDNLGNKIEDVNTRIKNSSTEIKNSLNNISKDFDSDDE